jgi:hypothetical protein
MAKLTSLITFSGTLDNLSSYTISGREGHILRRKGGASREKIFHDPCFENTRRTISEFGGRGPATHRVLEALKPLQTGQGTTGTINRLLNTIQKMDAHSEWGRRAVALSVAPELLRGLDISRRLVLNTIVPNLFPCDLSRDTRSGRIDVPALLPGVNCLHPKTYPFFKVVTVLGIVPDLFYHEGLKCFLPEEGFQNIAPQKAETSWLQTNKASEATILNLQLPGSPATERFSLLLSVAIEYGRHSISGAIEAVPKAVASKILAAV